MLRLGEAKRDSMAGIILACCQEQQREEDEEIGKTERDQVSEDPSSGIQEFVFREIPHW